MWKLKTLSKPSVRIAAGLMVVFLLAGCGKSCRQMTGSGAKGLELIPVESNFVMGVDWEKVQKSSLGEKIKQGLPPEAAPFVQNIQKVVVGFGLTSGTKGPENAVAVMQGKFDPNAWIAQMNEQAKKRGATVTEEAYEGIKIHSTSNDPDVGVAFLEGKALIGKKDMVKKSIDLSKGKGSSVEKNKEVMEIVADVDQKRMLWIAGKVPEGAMPPAGPGSPLAALSTMKAMDLAVDFIEGVKLDLAIFSATDEDAKQLLNTVNSYKTLLGTSMAMQNPAVGKLLQNLTAENKGKKVTVALKVDQATVDELSKNAPIPGAAPLGAPPVDPSAVEGGSPTTPPAPTPKAEAAPTEVQD